MVCRISFPLLLQRILEKKGGKNTPTRKRVEEERREWRKEALPLPHHSDDDDGANAKIAGEKRERRWGGEMQTAHLIRFSRAAASEEEKHHQRFRPKKEGKGIGEEEEEEEEQEEGKGGGGRGKKSEGTDPPKNIDRIRS